MPGTITSATIYGIQARRVTVEVDVQHGLPKVMVVGLPDAAIQEARERIRSAIKNSGVEFPLRHITISLSPADWRKEGAGFDLPVAIALLIATGQLPAHVFSKSLIVGELNLAGDVRPVAGVLAMAELAQRQGLRLIVPADNAEEAAVLSGIDITPVSSLAQVIDLAFETKPWPSVIRRDIGKQRVSHLESWPLIRGQAAAKRAMTIAAAGGHNTLMIGPPGSGKTMLARAIGELLPAMTEPEALLVTKIHSISGQLSAGHGLLTQRPFRQPHHTMSVAALIGGGRIPRPGELSLAHHGILFLDEFAEFSRDHIEALRQPLEDGIVTVSRVAGTMQFPAAGMLVAAMNPCPCGFLHDRDRVCRCTSGQIAKYQRRVSGPILDRFDIFVSVPRVPLEELRGPAVTEDPRADISRVRTLQQSRGQYLTNSQLRGRTLLEICQLGSDEQQFLESAVERLHLSMRAYHRIMRVSRTIADLSGAKKIQRQHLAEALQYRPPSSIAGSMG